MKVVYYHKGSFYIVNGLSKSSTDTDPNFFSRSSANFKVSGSFEIFSSSLTNFSADSSISADVNPSPSFTLSIP